ncbi:ethyl tert-butyl ether degradation protein EthD [Sphingomonas oleivorans]|uniref:Ethyl tert-butyl ether degradation protein EthD n=1 Tax=Sphingomonas oleivorans TaxID=1735121 RepID=A0A2T5FWM0_9SPHN|nr:EthD domain-containing protein [Sphingomonas oleivorans]PTQ10177.1 ethyl tert-butyl ether degradation protein EthD [Sphingomonas oleivorans]
MIKLTMFLKRNPALDREEFVRHHVERHGPLFRSIPEAKEHVLRYIQTHPVEDMGSVKPADYDGTAEIWFDSVAGMDAVLGSETYRKTVFPDEKSFLDHDHCLTLVGTVEVMIGDTDPAAP